MACGRGVSAFSSRTNPRKARIRNCDRESKRFPLALPRPHYVRPRCSRLASLTVGPVVRRDPTRSACGTPAHTIRDAPYGRVSLCAVRDSREQRGTGGPSGSRRTAPTTKRARGRTGHDLGSALAGHDVPRSRRQGLHYVRPHYAPSGTLVSGASERSDGARPRECAVRESNRNQTVRAAYGSELPGCD